MKPPGREWQFISDMQTDRQTHTWTSQRVRLEPKRQMVHTLLSVSKSHRQTSAKNTHENTMPGDEVFSASDGREAGLNKSACKSGVALFGEIGQIGLWLLSEYCHTNHRNMVLLSSSLL